MGSPKGLHRIKSSPATDGVQVPGKTGADCNKKNANSETHEIMSNNSLDMHRSLGQDDLAKDCGIFNIDIGPKLSNS